MTVAAIVAASADMSIGILTVSEDEDGAWRFGEFKLIALHKIEQNVQFYVIALLNSFTSSAVVHVQDLVGP